jgi:micrococcal nuclease
MKLIVKKLVITVFSVVCAVSLYMPVCNAKTSTKTSAGMVKVLKITDGDTIVVILGANKEKVRLIGIDCPETSKNNRAFRQAYEAKLNIDEVVKRGKIAKERLRKIINASNDEVTLIIEGKDRYERILGRIYDSQNNDIGKKLANEGYCLPYTYKK